MVCQTNESEMRCTPSPNVAYIIDPKIPGGSSAALAQELKAIAPLVRPKVYAVTSNMSAKYEVSTVLDSALQELGLEMVWDPKTISTEIAILRNPSFLNLEEDLPINIVARHLVVVANECFLSPSGKGAFDVQHCLDVADRASLTLSKSIAPVSPPNRSTIEDWFKKSPQTDPWEIYEHDWFSVCDFTEVRPTKTPKDRRGRYASRDLKYFPTLSDMDLAFPHHTEANVMLGAEQFISKIARRTNWDSIPDDVAGNAHFLDLIDFMIYFTSPTWLESFSLEIAESIAAGKLVISDAETASTFGAGVVPASPKDVDKIIAGYISDPGTYVKQVLLAQRGLRKFSSDRFREFFCENVGIINKNAA